MADVFPTVVDLNVGGKKMTTLLSTLTKDKNSMLTAMFSGRHVINKDKDGCYFIDCDGNVFKHILNYLRFGNLPPAEEALKVFDLATYFGIQSFVDALDKYQPVQHTKMIAEMKITFDIEQYEALKQDILSEILKAKVDPKQNKVLHIFPRGTHNANKCASLYHVKLPIEQFRSFINICNIEIMSNHTMSPDIQKCLAHDLCQLGFGEYTYLPIYHERRTRCCTIFLLTNNFLKMCYDYFNP